jgi:hypothetical protein
MSSSTSSFDTPVHAVRALLTGVVLSLLVLGAAELSFRRAGLRPSVPNTASRWGDELRRGADDPDGLFLVGSSRFQTTLIPGVMSQEVSRNVYNLSMDDNNPLPYLEYIAYKTQLNGVVLIEGMPLRLFAPDEDSLQKSYKTLVGAAPLKVSEPLDNQLGAVFYGRLVILHPSLRLREIFGNLYTNRRLPYAHVSMDADRSLGIDFTRLSDSFFAAGVAKVHAEAASHRYLSDEALSARLKRYEDAIQAIKARGGAVVVFRPPASGAYLEMERSLYPTSLWWARRLPRNIDCSVSFESFDIFKEFKYPDGSHPDMRDRERLTRVIADALSRQCGALFKPKT